MIKQQNALSPSKPSPILKIAQSKIKFAPNGNHRNGQRTDVQHHNNKLLNVPNPNHILPPLIESMSISRMQKRSESLQNTIRGFESSPHKRNTIVKAFGNVSMP